MFSGPWEKIAISATIGVLIGAADAAGFFYTVKLFIAKSPGHKKVLAGIFEVLRLVLIVAFTIFLISKISILVIPLFIAAFVLSMGGKMVLIIKGLNK
jgi:hypothetical protein